jgi:hypothetical protein
MLDPRFQNLCLVYSFIRCEQASVVIAKKCKKTLVPYVFEMSLPLASFHKNLNTCQLKWMIKIAIGTFSK